MTDLNLDNFIITRKRKKYRFALFANAPNCFELSDWVGYMHEGQSFMHRPVTVEVGAGTGLFLVELAEQYPEATYIALDVKADRLQKGARLALERGLTNIWFVRARADQLLEVVPEHSLSEVWLTFSDPFPRVSDAKRRLTAPCFLQLYQTALATGGILRQKTDSHALFDWSLEQLVTHGWSIIELSYDLHASDLPDDYKILTTYERKWQAEGLKTQYVSACASK
ncbi:tRNA (guanosine(46)-N7)-methyltransferase TrmB [Candidatus Saccharibacteria bacterium]|nr:tRNA (guanosine(46)-N7)-methyltransferase TrmB [Candidatus Saccharibacteria bacterium]